MHKRVLKFMYCLNKSCNLYNKISLQLAINGSQSHMCNTINYVCYKYNIWKYDLFSTKPPMWCHKINNSVQPADSMLSSTEIIKDMLHCRDSHNYSFFKLHEINTILLTVCTA